jgi:transketolase
MRDAMSDLRRKARLRLLQMHFDSGVGHIGGNLSSLDLMLVLHHRILGADDSFVLSKGHAAGALYVTLWSIGRLGDDDLKTFHRDPTRLPGHPPSNGIPGVQFATGSLGHGLGLSAGLALGKRLQGKPGRVFCLTSDGEWNEGSSWEALTFVAHQQLDAVRVLVDLNGLQGFGTTASVANLGRLAEKLRHFGWETTEIDGHDPVAIEQALRTTSSRPVAIVARTVKGHGVSFMENKMEWHYLPMTAAQYQQAVLEVGRP